MKKAYLQYGLLFVLVACLFAFPVGCGSASDRVENGGGGGGGNTEEAVQSVAASISVTVATTPINAEGSTQVTADVRDASNDPVPDGTTVTYSLEDPLWGDITQSATTSGGIATGTFTAANQTGTTQITASSGNATGSTNIEILQVAAAAIQFVSATPNVIAIAGTAGDTISEILFEVLDSNGNPLEGVEVIFDIVVTPGGGASILPDSASTNSEGIAMVRLYSGTVAGPVTVSATIDLPMTVQTTGVSIGGGVPSDKPFSVSASVLNLPGIVFNGMETEVTAWLADRFGSYNILQGTTVSFGTEVGLTTDSANITLADDGVAGVMVRTQAGSGGAHAEDVQPVGWETDLQTILAGTYGYTGTTAHPRDGLCSVTVYTRGEEHFDDLNANGMYDPLYLPPEFDPSYDTDEDPFYDYNDNGTYDGSASPDPTEIYIDAEGNGVWNGGDTVWSADTYIFRNFKILVTGKPTNVAVNHDLSLGPIEVDPGNCVDVKILVADENFNQMVAGSSVNISSDVGLLSGLLEREYADSNQVGPDEYSHLSLIEYDLDLCHDGTAAEGQITLVITWTPGQDQPDDTWTYLIPVSLN
jgi:hypothetical protein